MSNTTTHLIALYTHYIYIIYDTMNIESFKSAEKHATILKKMQSSQQDLIVILLGNNKNKNSKNRVVTLEQGHQCASKSMIPYFEITSLKDIDEINHVFITAIEKVSLYKTIASWRSCLLDLTQPISTRTRAAFYLRTQGSSRARDCIVEALQVRTDTPLMRHELAYILGQMQQPEACEALAAILSDESDDLLVRHESGEALGAIGDPTYVDVFLQFSKHERPEIAETCQIAVDLFRWREENKKTANVVDKSHNFLSVDPAPPAPLLSISELERDLLDTSKSLFHRYRAMFALRNINSDDSALALTRGLKDASALFRHEVAYVLGQMEREVTVDALAAVLRDASEHRMVRHECAESLGAIGTDSVTELLSQFKVDEESVVGESCVVALDAMEYWKSFEEN